MRHHFITSNLRLEWFTQSGSEWNDSSSCTSGSVESMCCRYEATPDSRNCCWWGRNSTDRRQDINNQHDERPRRHSDCLSHQWAACIQTFLGRWMAAILSTSESAHVSLDKTESNLNLVEKKIAGPIGMLEEEWSRATDMVYLWQRQEAAVRQLAS